METTKQVLRQLISMKERSQPVPLEVCMLQFLYELLIKSSDEVEKIKTVLMVLLKDALALNMTPPALFVLMAILNIYVQYVPVSEERRARRELQVRLVINNTSVTKSGYEDLPIKMYFEMDFVSAVTSVSCIYYTTYIKFLIE